MTIELQMLFGVAATLLALLALLLRFCSGSHRASGLGGGLVVARQHGFDGVGLVFGEEARVILKRNALAPFHVDHLDIEIVPLAEVDPEVRELSKARCQDLVARRKGVGDRSFPTAGARGREKENLPGFGLEHLLQVFKERQGKGRKIRSSLILHRHVDCTAQALGNVRGSRNE